MKNTTYSFRITAATSAKLAKISEIDIKMLGRCLQNFHGFYKNGDKD